MRESSRPEVTRDFKVLILMALAASLLLVSCPEAQAEQSLKGRAIRAGARGSPRHFQNQHGEPVGFAADVLKAVLKDAGCQGTISHHHELDAMSELAQGRLDVALCASFSPEWDKYADFSAAYLTVRYVLFRSVEAQSSKGRSLPGKRVAVAVSAPAIKSLGERMGFELMAYPSITEALRPVAKGELDYALVPLSRALHIAGMQGWGHLRPLGEPLVTETYAFAVAEENGELLGKLNTGLLAIRDSGRMESIHRKWFGGFELDKGLPEAYLKALALAAGCAFLILLGFGLWSWSLRRKVNERTKELKDELAIRRKAEEELRESEERYRDTVESIPDALVITSLDDGIFRYANKAFEHLSGFSRKEAMGRNAVELGFYMQPSDRQRVLDILRTMGYFTGMELLIRRKDGTIRDAVMACSMIRYGGEECVVTLVKDVSEEKRNEKERIKLQDRLRQGQKMEAIGTLAGGIAHDFNNILQAIGGYLSLLPTCGQLNSAQKRQMTQIEGALDRAGSLIRQLMVFSHKLEPDYTTVDLSSVVDSGVRLLRRTIPPMIKIDLSLPDRPVYVFGDRTQLEQIIMNLGANARDAMPDGGCLTIDLKTRSVSKGDAGGEAAVEQGRYAELVVADNGQGMDEKTLTQIFDPFFTTKEVGKGTGLGLSTVYGIIKGHDGRVFCRSLPGRGAAFTVLLPLVDAADVIEYAPKPWIAEAGGTETVLVVDDEPSILETAGEALEMKGYDVLTANCGEDALQILTRPENSISLVVLDLGMPGMGGVKTLKELRRLLPGIKVIIASGYLDGNKLREIQPLRADAFLPKPYSLGALSSTVRELLDSGG